MLYCMVRFTRKVNVTTNYWELHVMIQMRNYLVSNKSDKFKNTIKKPNLRDSNPHTRRYAPTISTYTSMTVGLAYTFRINARQAG